MSGGTLLKCFTYILLFCFTINLVESKLILLHTIFRHGERTSDTRFMYPTDPHRNKSFFPYGNGQLTNLGKNTMYGLGKNLRTRYSEFLTDVYFPDFVDAWASSLSRTQVALQTVLAGLFPPNDELVWNKDLKWQPIAYNVLPQKYDTLILPMLLENFMEKYNEFCKSDAAKGAMQDAEPVLAYIRKYSGLEAYTPRIFFFLYITLITEEDYGLELPKWTKKIYPQPLTDMIHLEFELEMGTKELRRYLLGHMLKKILSDIDNKIAGKSACKIHLYSAHDVNVVYILMFLGIMYKHAPGYSSCLVLEVHEEDQHFYIQVHYKENKNSDYKLLPFANGDKRLYLNDFRGMIEDLLENEKEGGRERNTFSNNVSSKFSEYMTYYQAVLLIFYYKSIL